MRIRCVVHDTSLRSTSPSLVATAMSCRCFYVAQANQKAVYASTSATTATERRF